MNFDSLQWHNLKKEEKPLIDPKPLNDSLPVFRQDLSFTGFGSRMKVCGIFVDFVLF